MSEVEVCCIIKKLTVSLNRIRLRNLENMLVHYFQKEKTASNEQKINEKFRIISFSNMWNVPNFLEQ